MVTLGCTTSAAPCAISSRNPNIVASFSPEAEEADDDSPTLSQPSIRPERILVWVPFSFEVGGDYPGFTGELAKLVQDARDSLEAEKFLAAEEAGAAQAAAE